MRVSHASGYAQPFSRPVLIADENGFHVSVGPDALIYIELRVVCRSQAEEVVVALKESVKAYFQTMPTRRRGSDSMQSAVMRTPVMARDKRLVFRASQKLPGSEMIKRRDRQDEMRPLSVYPG